MRLRSIIALPAGHGPGEEILGSEADAVLLTLADASLPVGSLRRTAVEAIKAVSGAGKVALILANHPRTQLLRDDLDAIVGAHCSAVLLKHTSEPQDVRDAAVLLREFEFQRDIEPGTIMLLPVIDTARGLMRATEIAAAALRVGGLVLDADRYSRDIAARAEEEGPRLAFARGLVTAAARAIDGLPLVAGAHLELRHHAQFGFAGAIVHNVSAVGIANQAFTPTDAQISRARALRDAYAAARAEGLVVGRFGDEVADASSARRARQTLEAAGLDPGG
jgi:citrate lyase subunit beta/citryl-CoA lyase